MCMCLIMHGFENDLQFLDILHNSTVIDPAIEILQTMNVADLG